MLTDEGRAVRDRIEDQTDSAFYAIWQTLTSDELDDLYALVTALKARLEIL